MDEAVRDFVEKVLRLQSHIEDVTSDEQWEKISVPVWNEVSCHEVVRKARECTCLTELQDDAYGPGGPMSGHPKPPPCRVHTPC